MIQDLSLSNIKVGQTASFEIELTKDKVKAFADLVGDYNPLHMDESFGQKSEFSKCITHGMLLASHFSTLIGMYLPGKNALYLSQEITFDAPVPVANQALRVEGTVLKISEATRTLTIRTEIFNANNEKVVSGKGRAMVFEHYEEKHIIEETTGSSLNGKVALITGASRGIGAQTAILFAKQGAKVVINHNRSLGQANAVADIIRGFGGSVLVVSADVAQKGDVERLFAEIHRNFGVLDILVNGAAPPPVQKKITESVWEEYERDLSVILKGAYLNSLKAAEDMIEKKSGVIVNVLTSYTIGSPPVNLGSYVTAKYALMGFTKVIAGELGPLGIRINAVSPGLTETAFSANLPQRLKDLIAFQTPLKRNATPIDIARVILFLVSDAASFLHGAIVPVCGGHVM